MKFGGVILCSCVALLCAGCASSPPQAEPESPSDVTSSEALPQASAPGSSSSAQSADPAASGAKGPEDAAAQPEFAPGMSVVDATNAVPAGGQRLDIEQEALAAPLMRPELYEPCELQGHHHFKVKVAVWDGRAVGLDVTTQPNDAKLESCLRQQLSGVEWKDKAKSLNTVEYSY